MSECAGVRVNEGGHGKHAEGSNFLKLKIIILTGLKSSLEKLIRTKKKV